MPCHGFLFLDEGDAQLLQGRRGVDFALDKVDLGFQRGAVGGTRVRAIVKELASSDHGVGSARSLFKILEGIKGMNGQKLFNMDIRLDNYRDGMVVDFGSSWTEPCPLLDALDEGTASTSRRADLDLFDQMLSDEDIPNPTNVRATPNLVYCKKLRPRKKKK